MPRRDRSNKKMEMTPGDTTEVAVGDVFIERCHCRGGGGPQFVVAAEFVDTPYHIAMGDHALPPHDGDDDEEPPEIVVPHLTLFDLRTGEVLDTADPIVAIMFPEVATTSCVVVDASEDGQLSLMPADGELRDDVSYLAMPLLPPLADVVAAINAGAEVTATLLACEGVEAVVAISVADAPDAHPDEAPRVWGASPCGTCVQRGAAAMGAAPELNCPALPGITGGTNDGDGSFDHCDTNEPVDSFDLCTT
jgi:hypothetical protein